ncbi:MAG: glutamate racemase [Chloroflexi bacterium]|nr:glutamate racemase [Chloroflexota bacterium]
MNSSGDTRPVGVFDSGVGGLSVLRAIRQQLPKESILYFGDQGHVPYGPRSVEEIRGFSYAITRFLLSLGAKLIVVACNTASAVALHSLRQAFPDISFVGMEPAVKPAAENTRTGVVGVLATPATFQGALYASVVERFAGNVTLLQNTCPGLVQQIEDGALDSSKTREILESALSPMIGRGIDVVVLGCTHYPFVIPLIQEIVGPDVRVIDPAPAVARQVVRLLDSAGKRAGWTRTEFRSPKNKVNISDSFPLSRKLPKTYCEPVFKRGRSIKNLRGLAGFASGAHYPRL